jgi:hypothetical protein
MFPLFRWRDAKISPDDEMDEALYKLCSNPAKLPDKVSLWYDAYFDMEADADAMARYLYGRRIETNRDFDDEPDEVYGAWNVDWEFAVPPRHLDLKMAHEGMLLRVGKYRGKLGSWLLMQWDDDEND